MGTSKKKAQIKKLVKEMLKDSYKHSLEKINKALNSGAIDVDSWDSNNGPMILPKTIVTAILEDEASQYKGQGTNFEKKVAKDVKNLKMFL